MKYIQYILVASVLLTVSCKQDDFDFEGPAVSFYPTVIQKGAEEDGITYILPLAVSGPITNSGTAIVQLNTSAEGVITTVPPLNGTRIEVEFNSAREAVILVTIGNDAVPEDYTATFTIIGTSGEITGIGREKFTLIVDDRDIAPIFSENFNSCSNLNSFSQYSVTGAQVWSCTNFGIASTSGVRMNGYAGGAQTNEDWLISEALDLTGLGTASASFYTDRAFTGPEIEFKVSTNYSGTGDPNAATWTTLPAIYDTQSGNDTWTYSGALDVSSYLTSSTYFAFVYRSSPSEGASQWTVDDFEISIFHPNASGGGNDNLVALPFSDDFEACTTDFGTPVNWDAKNLTAKTDRNFSCRPFGVGDSRGVRVNAFSGTTGTVDTWLISKNKFDLTNLAAGTFSADIRSATAGGGTFEVLYSTDYFRESPALATWNAVPNVADQLPTKGSNSYTTVSGVIPGGQPVYLAFRFSGASHDNSASYDIDNVTFEEYENTIALPYNDSFEMCASSGEFNIPDNWVEAFMPGSKTDRGFGCRDADTNLSPRTGAWLISASAFGGTAGTDNVYYILNAPINFDELTTVNVSFYVDLDFATDPGSLTFEYSTNYNGSGDPSGATWTAVPSITAAMPTANSTSWQQITADLSSINGSSVYLAFHFNNGGSGGSKRYNLDDFSLTGN